MKIKKVLLYNFKNFKEKTVIDFKDNITFLVGPNGFGKTTIFDAIELGLTGNISRVNSKNKITPENIRYNKPFFQNDKNLPIYIKLWLEKENDERLIVVRKFEHITAEGRNDFAPLKSIGQFQLYEQNISGDSDFYKIDNLSLKSIKQNRIDEFLDFNENYGIDKIFNLFNYIQQEETTFFLKQSEQKRSDSLSFLIKTDKVENKIEDIKKVSGNIEKRIINLSNLLNNLKQEEIGDIPYYKLFNHKLVAFDQEYPFTKDNLNLLEVYFEEIQKIIDFKKNFSIPEYKKNRERNEKKNVIENDLNVKNALYYCILSPIIMRSGNKLNMEIDTIKNPELIEYVLLEKYIINYHKVSEHYNRRKQLLEYIRDISSNNTKIYTNELVYSKEDIFAEDFQKLNKYIKHYKKIMTDSNEIEKRLNDLNRLRFDMHKKFFELVDNREINDIICPFCNSSFKTYEELKHSYEEFKEYLMKISSENSIELQELQLCIRNLVDSIKEKISEELKLLNIDIDEKLLKKIYVLNNNMYLKTKNLMEFKNFIKFYTNIDTFELGKLSFNDYDEKYRLRLEEFQSNLPLDKNVYDLLVVKGIDNAEKKYRDILNEYNDFDFDLFILIPNKNIKISENMVNNKLDELKKQLKIMIDQKYSINENIINDFNRILPYYFNNNLELLEKTSIVDLEQKKHYIEKQAILVKNQQYIELSKNIDILNKAKNHLDKIKNIYEEEVKLFKINIIKQLRIPFFIYSAKMLQNYQQGLGIFLTYKEGTENTEDKAVIKFKSDSGNDHDAIHQLSTGQLAVVSLAFTLSLNTMFKLSEEIKFLMIDDPIQDMDAMNVLSFVEILRHGIIDRYQIILSTYSDSNALFMGYKFVNTNLNVDVEYKNVRELGVK